MAFFRTLGNLNFDFLGCTLPDRLLLLFLAVGIVIVELRDFVENDGVAIIMEVPSYFLLPLWWDLGELSTLGVIKATRVDAQGDGTGEEHRCDFTGGRDFRQSGDCNSAIRLRPVYRWFFVYQSR